MNLRPPVRSVLVVVLLALLAPAAARAQNGAEERAVYRAVLAPLVQADTRRLVVGDSTVIMSNSTRTAEFLQQGIPEVSDALLEDFYRRNARQVPLPDSLALPVQVERIGWQALRSMASPAGGTTPDEFWTEFYRRFPSSAGHVRLSRPGFNADRTVALVYRQHACGGRCGTGTFLLLRRSGNDWKVEESLVTTRS